MEKQNNQYGKGNRSHRHVSTKIYRDGWDNIFNKKSDRCPNCNGDLVLAEIYGVICPDCFFKNNLDDKQ